MRNIVALLYRFYHVFLFFILQGVAFSLIFAYSNYHRTSFVNGSGEFVGWFYNLRTAVTEPFTIREANDQLAAENAELRQALPISYRKMGNGQLIIDSVSLEQEFEYMSARVIDISLSRARNFIMLDKGANDGIEKEMGVISTQGIVGFVYDATAHYSLVIPIQSDLFSTSVKLGGTNDFGVLRWEGGDPMVANVYGISASRTISKGDRVLTKGASARFPEGVEVGTVRDYRLDPGNSDYTIRIDLTTNFRKLYNIYVIRALFVQEIDSLKQHMEGEE